jgi:hypothetical protein
VNFPWRLCFRLLAILSALAALLIGCMGASLLNDQLGSVGFSIQAAPSTPREAGFRASGPGCPPGRLTFASDRTFWLPRCQSVPPGSASCSPGSIESAPRPSTAACSTTHVSRSLSPPGGTQIDPPLSIRSTILIPYKRDSDSRLSEITDLIGSPPEIDGTWTTDPPVQNPYNFEVGANGVIYVDSDITGATQRFRSIYRIPFLGDPLHPISTGDDYTGLAVDRENGRIYAAKTSVFPGIGGGRFAH